MPRRLTKTVHVYDDKGDAVVLVPGDSVPAWAKDQVSNPKLWEGDDDPVVANEDIPPDAEADTSSKRK